MLGGAFLTKGKMYDTLNKFNALKDKENVTILGIESSCDETAASVVRNGREVLSSVISSQINIHRLFGGVVPEVASRNHTLAVNNVIDEALEKAVAADADTVRAMAGEDFNSLLAFLKYIANSDFWRAEVVQIVLAGGGNKHMELRFVPRSGGFIVDMGTPTNFDTKLSNLYRFYHKGLNNLGWDKYRSISLRYEGQVVCR